jgi:hypothetical protein
MKCKTNQESASPSPQLSVNFNFSLFPLHGDPC